MKPWEEDWALEQKRIACPDHLTHVISGSEGVVGAFLFLSEARLAVAAPKMARLLLEEMTATGHWKGCPNWFSVHTTCSERCTELRSLLTSAGVLS